MWEAQFNFMKLLLLSFLIYSGLDFVQMCYSSEVRKEYV